MMKKTAQKIHASTQRFTEIEDIVENVVVLSFGNACLVIEVAATNFSLLSREEQDAKIFAYASMLNSLSFPIQILVRSKRIDISNYLRVLDEESKKTPNQMLANQIKLYRDFVEKLVRINTVLDKKFYIVIPYSYLEKGVFQKNTFLKDATDNLNLKAESIYSQLKRLGLPAKTLKKEELVKLFYEVYNREFERPIDIEYKMPIIKSEGAI